MDSPFGSYSGGAYTALPASQLLQERLQERRARNMLPKRSRQTDIGLLRGADDDIFLNEAEDSGRANGRMYDSSPLMAGARVLSESTASRSSKYGKRQSIGARDVDDQIDRLSKQNFALKLELDHRRDHTVRLQEDVDAMRGQVERAELLQEEHTELLRINTQLVEELEKRDKAVEEAMDIICDLEDKVSDLEERRSHTRPSTANADSGYAGTETQELMPPASPPRVTKMPRTPTLIAPMPPPSASAASHKLQGVLSRQTPAKLRREPSILSQRKPSTHALRSVYLEAAHSLHPVKSFASLLSTRDSRLEDDRLADEVLNSPRLSVLSESSFPSLYSPKKGVSPEKFAWEAGDEDEVAEEGLDFGHLRQDSIKRVSRWMEEHEGGEDAPSKSGRVASPLSVQTERGLATTPVANVVQDAPFQSLDNALSTAAATTERKSHELLQPTAYNPYQNQIERQRQHTSRPKHIGGPVFGEPLLPPTPDSPSTLMLRASRSSIVNERSIIDDTPPAVKGYDALEPGLRTAPKQMRSSVELNNAHGKYQQYRDVLGGHQPGGSSSDEEDRDEVAYADRVGTHRGDRGDRDDFPDGNSILMGTPSHFLKQNRPREPPSMFDPCSVSPTQARSQPHRRQSSAGVEVHPNPRKPSLGRAETSPTFLGTLGRLVTNGSKSTVADSVTSPRSFLSGSSSTRTVLQQGEAEQHHDRLTQSQPRVGPRSSASPARTLGQRTQMLFRRMSNSHAEPKGMLAEPRSPREKSPLPTLTSTPSSAYVNTAPKEVRRPSTASNDKPSPPLQRRPEGEGRRPSLQTRTQTAPGWAPSVAAVETERRNLFRRTGSTQHAVHAAMESPMSVGQYGTLGERDGGAGRPGMTRRRGSIRDAVAGRRPWH
ncbi:hypothetical protein LTR53_010590 [Teratosphaeriaceae sp. CCFEE 6253]|nr:hypothetical protein LTR53_010590 [Teratosphaeriaceae sp. CCFEE 6253]